MARFALKKKAAYTWEHVEIGGRSFLKLVLALRDDRQIRLTVPSRIAQRYEVQDLLARGGGGVILVAHDRKTGHRVLVKALAEYNTYRYDLKQPLDDIIESLARNRHHLQTERRILVQLRNLGSSAVPHPNDYVYDVNQGLRGPYRTEFGEEWTFDEEVLLASEPYLVMQFAPGMNLKEVVAKYYRNGLDEHSALRLIDQVARVLELIEQPIRMANGQTWELVYQDLKPGNILVDEYGHVTVIDFGGCQLMIDDVLVLHGSHSAGYCAPECGQGEPIGPEADVYGLGSTLFYLLAGVNPREAFAGDPEFPGTRAVKIDPTPLSGRLSSGCLELLSKCLNWVPDARYKNVKEFREALSELTAPVPV